VKPCVITGFGVASAVGIGRAAFLEAMRTGVTFADGDRSIETFDGSRYERARVAEVRGFDAAQFLGDKGLRSLDRLTKLLVVAARLALQDAGLKDNGAWAALPAGTGDMAWPERVGLVVSNAYGSLEAITELDRVAVLEDARYINPSRFPLTVSNSAAGYASIWEELRALNVSVSDGNCGALDAVACAQALLDQGRAGALLAGGAEAMSEALFLAFHRLGAEATCLGEGAALVVLETLEAARARAAKPLAEVIGFGTSFAAPERDASLVHATSDPLARAIATALSDAAISKREVDLVVSGVSGLRVFDDAELLAIQRALGEDVCVVAPKLVLGETLGAGGALAMLAAIAHMRAGGRAPAVRGVIRGEARTALVTSMGYYGNASALVMRAAFG
jgi:3-oxoacyl-(acyl-carrier-protein) synthase